MDEAFFEDEANPTFTERGFGYELVQPSFVSRAMSLHRNSFWLEFLSATSCDQDEDNSSGDGETLRTLRDSSTDLQSLTRRLVVGR